MKIDISISRPFHDYLLKHNEGELNRLYKLHKVKWSINGPTFTNVGTWYRLWLQNEHLFYITTGNESGIDMHIKYRK